jgi:hypothetical protein
MRAGSMLLLTSSQKPNTMKTHPCYEKAKSGEYLTHADRAKLIRSALKTAFPSVKFSVTTSTYSMGGDVRVSWMDGPRSRDVEAIAGTYQTKGFDGSIDMAFSKHIWLAPDGSASLAHSEGTAGSGGYHAREDFPAHHPKAVKVSKIFDGYVSCSRSISAPVLARGVEIVKAENWGVLESFDWANGVEIKTHQDGEAYLCGRCCSVYVHSHYLNEMISRAAREIDLLSA